MCANYQPVTRSERLKQFFDAEGTGLDACPMETWPGYLAPFVRARQGRAAVHSGRSLGLGLYGLIPHWAKGVLQGRHTYNARTETADQLSSFKYAWQTGQRCIVPVESYYDPCWESGKAVRWRVCRRDQSPMGVAGLWNAWRAPDGKEVLSFTMLTVNADGHGVMGRMHRPEDEKRMIAILAPDEYDQWLHAKPSQMKTLLRCWPAEELDAVPAPLPLRTAKPEAPQQRLF
jgi:putative SOS response-associated peptidase YedK